MIVKNFELKNFINKKKLFLIYGENEGLKEDLILEFSKIGRASCRERV